MLRRGGAALGLALVIILGGARSSGAQEVQRVSATVDYVGVEGIYLGVGTDAGVQAGDTVLVYATPGETEPLGRIVVTASFRRRSVAKVVEPDFPLGAGSEISLAVRPIQARDPAAAAVTPSVGQAPTGAVRTRSAAVIGGPRVSGRLSLQVDARETRTSWQGDLFGETRRRFATPTTSLSLTARDLPGGLRLETSLRGQYRYTDFNSLTPTTSMRVYSLAAVKTFDSFEMRLGRFYNPYESYSAFWDGAMMRLGRRSGPGIGVVAGYEPTRSDEGFSTELPKVTGFADFAARGRGWRYDTDLSYHALRPAPDSLSNRTYAGWSQSLTVGRLSFNQRVRADRNGGSGTWRLTQMRFRTGLSIAGPLRLNAGFNRIRPSVLRGFPVSLSPEREEMTGGLSAYGPDGSFSVDVGTTKWDGDARGLSVTASGSRRLGGALLSASGRRWSRSDMTSIAAAPAISFEVLGFDTRLGYQLYQTDGVIQLRSHAGDASFTARVGGNLSITLRGQQQWGANFQGTRVSLRLWRSF